MRSDLYTVVEHNQASRQPDDQGVTLWWNLDEAVEQADSLTADNRGQAGLAALVKQRDELQVLVEILSCEQPDGEEYDVAERALMAAWPDLARDRVYVEQVVRVVLDAAWAVNHKRHAGWHAAITLHESQLRAALLIPSPLTGRPEPRPSCHVTFGHPAGCRCEEDDHG